jgi:membrane protein involved in colicin uptake
MNSYQVVSAKIPLLDLFESNGVAKAEAEAKAAAELKAKQEADAKAAAELKAKQEADAKAAAELKAKQEADAKAAAELKAKQEVDAKAAAELKAKQDADAARILAEAKAAAAKKKTTITCIKGKLIKKVTAVKPSCPTGYKKK